MDHIKNKLHELDTYRQKTTVNASSLANRFFSLFGLKVGAICSLFFQQAAAGIKEGKQQQQYRQQQQEAGSRKQGEQWPTWDEPMALPPACAAQMHAPAGPAHRGPEWHRGLTHEGHVQAAGVPLQWCCIVC